MKSILLLLSVFFIQSSRATELGAGLSLTSFNYEEDITPPGKSKESGLIPILFGYLAGGAGTANPNTGGFGPFGWRLEFEGILEAQTNYDGTTLTTNAAAAATDKNTFMNMRALAVLPVNNNLYIYGGVGYRYWNRYLAYGTGYREIYTWSYLPVGFRCSFNDANSQIRVSLDGAYNYMTSGQIQVIFSQTVTSGDDTTLTLGAKPGYKVSLPIDIKLSGNNFRLSMTPYFEYSEIGKSDTKYNSTPTSGGGSLGYIQEPNSKTSQYGLAGLLVFEI